MSRLPVDDRLRALLAATYEDPEEKAPRLVLADYLEESGDAVAGALLRREAHYLTRHTNKPLQAELGKRLGLPPKKTYWDHGLPWHVDLSVANLGKVPAPMRRAAAQGWIGQLTLTGFNRQKSAAVAAAGWLQEVPRLAFRLHPRADAVAAIEALPPWDNLAGLDAPENPTLTDAAVGRLAAHQRLSWVDFPRCPLLTDAVIGPLANLPELRWGRLSSPGIVRVEPPAGGFPGLRRLDLSGCRKLSALRLVGLPQLSEVNLSGGAALEDVWLINLPAYVRLDAHGMRSLWRVEVSEVPQLAWLYLTYCRGLRELRIAGTPCLKHLDVTGCPQLPEETVAALRLALPRCYVRRR
jgi:uncharacterized protein (TIGR02996 family)